MELLMDPYIVEHVQMAHAQDVATTRLLGISALMEQLTTAAHSILDLVAHLQLPQLLRQLQPLRLLLQPYCLVGDVPHLTYQLAAAMHLVYAEFAAAELDVAILMQPVTHSVRII